MATFRHAPGRQPPHSGTYARVRTPQAQTRQLTKTLKVAIRDTKGARRTAETPTQPAPKPQSPTRPRAPTLQPQHTRPKSGPPALSANGVTVGDI